MTTPAQLVREHHETIQAIEALLLQGHPATDSERRALAAILERVRCARVCYAPESAWPNYQAEIE